MEAHLNTNYYLKLLFPKEIEFLIKVVKVLKIVCIFYEIMGSETISTIN